MTDEQLIYAQWFKNHNLPADWIPASGEPMIGVDLSAYGTDFTVRGFYDKDEKKWYIQSCEYNEAD